MALAVSRALDLPLVYVGGVISRANADEVLDREGFDFVQMGRVLLATSRIL